MQGENKHQAVAIHDVRYDVVVHGVDVVLRLLPGQTIKVTVELQPVGLPESPTELHDSKEPPVAVLPLLLLQHQHEEKANAGLHHSEQGANKHQSVTVADGCCDSLTALIKCRLSCPAMVTVKLQLLDEALSMPGSPDKLHHGKKPPLAIQGENKHQAVAVDDVHCNAVVHRVDGVSSSWSACLSVSTRCTMVKNHRWPSYVSCFSSTSMKRKVRQDRISQSRGKTNTRQSLFMKSMSLWMKQCLSSQVRQRR